LVLGEEFKKIDNKEEGGRGCLEVGDDFFLEYIQNEDKHFLSPLLFSGSSRDFTRSPY